MFGVAPVAAIGLALRALPTVLSLLRHNSTIRGAEFTMSTNAVTAAVAQKLRTHRAEVVVDRFAPVPQNEVFSQLKGLRDDRDRLADLRQRGRARRSSRRRATSSFSWSCSTGCTGSARRRCRSAHEHRHVLQQASILRARPEVARS